MSNIAIPKITFLYNGAYDSIYKELFNAKKKSGEVITLGGVVREHYPTTIEIKEKKLELATWRDLHGVGMLEIISKELGLGRKQNHINCWIIGYCHLFGAMAAPLTINSHYPNSVDFLGSVAVTHEMIHLIQQENPQTKKPYCENVAKQFNLDVSLGIHSLVFAVQNVMLEKTGRKGYIDDIIRHYEGKEETKIWAFIKEYGSTPLLQTFFEAKK